MSDAPRTLGDWIDCGEFSVSNIEQGSDDWKRLRVGRLTMSNLGAALGHSKFSKPHEVALDITGIKPKEFTEESQRIMKLGNEREPLARDWYCQKYGYTVSELGVAIPKKYPYVGASVDGCVVGLPWLKSSCDPLNPTSEGILKYDGLIEIKCPEKMYKPISDYLDFTRKGIEFPPFYRDHIWPTHYDQMQGCMGFMGKKWCDYIVFCLNEDKVFVQRIPFNTEYWEKTLLPGAQNFIQTELLPLIQEHKIEVLMPKTV